MLVVTEEPAPPRPPAAPLRHPAPPSGAPCLRLTFCALPGEHPQTYLGTPTILIPFAVMEVHYMLHAGFMRRGQLLDNVKVMAEHGHKVAIAHGRADYVCQPQAAYRLAQALGAVGAQCELEIVAGAGHSDSEPGLIDAMVRATDKFRDVAAVIA